MPMPIRMYEQYIYIYSFFLTFKAYDAHYILKGSNILLKNYTNYALSHCYIRMKYLMQLCPNSVDVFCRNYLLINFIDTSCGKWVKIHVSRIFLVHFTS